MLRRRLKYGGVLKFSTSWRIIRLGTSELQDTGVGNGCEGGECVVDISAMQCDG